MIVLLIYSKKEPGTKFLSFSFSRGTVLSQCIVEFGEVEEGRLDPFRKAGVLMVVPAWRNPQDSNSREGCEVAFYKALGLLDLDPYWARRNARKFERAQNRFIVPGNIDIFGVLRYGPKEKLLKRLEDAFFLEGLNEIASPALLKTARKEYSRGFNCFTFAVCWAVGVRENDLPEKLRPGNHSCSEHRTEEPSVSEAV